MGDKKSAKLVDQASVLLVTDVKRAARFWHEQLGFGAGSFWGNPPDSCLLTRDGQHVFLAQISDPHCLVPFQKFNPNLWNLYLFVDDVEALQREFKKAGVAMAYGLTDQPYRCREFGVRDPDGNIIAFGQNLDGSL